MDPAAVIDDLLEITVIGSFSRIGYAVRRRLFGWTTPRAGLAGRADRPADRRDVRARARGRGRSWRRSGRG